MLWAGIPISLKTSMIALRYKSQRTLLSLAVAYCACCACMVSFLPRAYAQEAAIFFTDRGTGKVHSSDPAGGDNKILATIQSSNLRGIVADVPDGKVYFADNGTGKIYQVHLDGTGL